MSTTAMRASAPGGVGPVQEPPRRDELVVAEAQDQIRAEIDGVRDLGNKVVPRETPPG